MRQITVNVYQFDELSDTAKERAREWWREGFGCDEWWDTTYEGAENVGLKITSFDLDRHEISGEFTGNATECAEKIIEDHGRECETYKTARAFLDRFEALPKDEAGEPDDEDREELEREFLQSILEDYRIMLRKELEYQMSDEQVDDAIRANEYEFDEDGARV